MDDTLGIHDYLSDLCDPDIDHAGLSDIDPDINFIPTISSKYYNINDINTSLNKHPFNGFSILSHNIRSAPKNLTQLTSYLDLLNPQFQFSVIGLTETWLSEDNCSAYAIPNYRATHMNRQNKKGGGVSIFLHQSITFKTRDDLSLSNNNIECIFIEVLRFPNDSSSKPLIAVIYRPPNSDIEAFLETLTQLFQKIKTEKKSCYIMGDFNLDISNQTHNTNAQEFLDLMHTNSFIQHIHQPTRITAHTKTLLDNIFSNTITPFQTSGILHTDITDHFPIFLLNPSKQDNEERTLIERRIFNEQNKRKFKQSLQNESWDSLYACRDALESYSIFSNTFQTLYNNAFPLTTKQIKHKRNKPWLSPGLRKSIKQKNKLFTIFRKRPTLTNEIKYKTFKQQLNRLLRTAEKSYYHTLLQRNSTNAKHTWKILKDLINKHRNHQPFPQLSQHNKLVVNPNEVVDIFNHHFTKIGPDLSKTIPRSQRTPESFLTGNYPHSFFFSPVTETEVQNAALLLKNGSPGHDGIQPDIIRENAEDLSAPLTHIFNCSFSQGKLHDDLKIASITPIFKAGDQENPNNYRPISILTTFSKILERIAYNKLIKYINDHNILSNHQFGFRKGHSCEMPLILAVDLISRALDQGEHVIGIFLDIKKAFDTVDANILLSKLHHYGFRGVAHDWLASYLTNRKQFVKCNKISSDPLPITCGIPQGSVLGPLLFLLFINDLCNLPTNLTPFVFADDTTLFLKGKDLQQMASVINTELSSVCLWLRTNKLSINVSKTHYIHFTLNRNTRNTPLNINIDNQPITNCSHTKFLGVVIDNQLSWSQHIQHISNKISKNIGALKKVYHLLNRKTLIQLYNTLILPYLSYCQLIWASSPRIHFNRLVILQKKAIRIICHSPRLAHTQNLFQNCRILHLNDLFKYNAGIFIYKYTHQIFPYTFLSQFTLEYANPSRNTRTALTQTLTTPTCRTTFKQKSVHYQLCIYYNQFHQPLNLTESPSLYSLKKSLKSILI